MTSFFFFIYSQGDPNVSVIAFASKNPKVNVNHVGDALSKRGWHLNILQVKCCLFYVFTVVVVPVSYPNIPN